MPEEKILRHVSVKIVCHSLILSREQQFTSMGIRVQKIVSTQLQSEEPQVEENPHAESEQVEGSQAGKPLSPPKATKAP